MTPARATDAEGERVLRMCVAIMKQMGIGQYTLRLVDGDADDDYLAKIVPMAHRHQADVYLCADWMNLTDEKKLNAIVHEMCHLVHRRQTDVIRVDLHASGYLPQPAYDLLWATFQRETELMVDHWATMFDDHWAIAQEWERIKGEVPDTGTKDAAADQSAAQ